MQAESNSNNNKQEENHRTSDGSGNTQLATQLGSVESTSMMQLWSQERDLNQLPFSEWQANQTSSHNSYHYQNGYGSNSNGY
ncbi:hypothetical protein MCOR29_002549 [Pyricularia oryzae]|nr:hypothetical protein MCOR30_007776 [Pyricularia oryzae]KAI6328540.1 hypothetical protein MCOR29_002549 [Pyricularia oryzae]KAI6380179.1 hypothetical protein MCOR32_004121 [Pyricularia oryzae]KAI6389991.1 hypothetical protein MCOR23_009804 [Pyricularia oryzae]KAI6443369.1 hypothetical protein MCOR15_011239 [Pyricularia oryzae]